DAAPALGEPRGARRASGSRRGAGGRGSLAKRRGAWVLECFICRVLRIDPGIVGRDEELRSKRDAGEAARFFKRLSISSRAA
ncbi:hypothetical protein, partial [Burkholderia gladioli]|uniref:hypothetical protein n=1 Tax=Burkholderia gladioli TaxID=28095 RepID=UPI001C3F3601